MQSCLQLRLGFHGLRTAAGRLAGAGQEDRTNKVQLACKHGNERHMIFECAALAPLRQQHVESFTV